MVASSYSSMKATRDREVVIYEVRGRSEERLINNPVHFSLTCLWQKANVAQTTCGASFFMIKCMLMIVQIFKTCRGLDYLQIKAQEKGACHMFNTTLNFFLPLAANF